MDAGHSPNPTSSASRNPSGSNFLALRCQSSGWCSSRCLEKKHLGVGQKYRVPVKNGLVRSEKSTHAPVVPKGGICLTSQINPPRVKCALYPLSATDRNIFSPVSLLHWLGRAPKATWNKEQSIKQTPRPHRIHPVGQHGPRIPGADLLWRVASSHDMSIWLRTSPDFDQTIDL